MAKPLSLSTFKCTIDQYKTYNIALGIEVENKEYNMKHIAERYLNITKKNNSSTRLIMLLFEAR